jgi:hypothetical protein
MKRVTGIHHRRRTTMALWWMGGVRSYDSEREKQEVFPAAPMDGFTAVRII